MNGIEFFHHPAESVPEFPVWGIRVDGTDLRAHTAWATRELWRPELEDQFEDQERESAEQLWGGFEGLWVREFAAGSFLTESDEAPLLGCPCGAWQCAPLLAARRVTGTTVTWSAFHLPFREHWGELPLGPFVFARDDYEASLASPPTLPKDPLGPPPPGLGV
ncbi:hypothetical protein [Streptomyces sp. Amel2xC10]|uniref:hypothetical protein n=1 Tax=Streptomyces sp. Amel2xC10 TaxID=1305826 RepID=UPI000A088F27|nr:hypothetical protein [Streptomyces sp. Amel2xC10]SMF18068.1 hypothetical protein SAMN02745830_02097 [Streptomyces sp. Amel2xC10]